MTKASGKRHGIVDISHRREVMERERERRYTPDTMMLSSNPCCSGFMTQGQDASKKILGISCDQRRVNSHVTL